MFSVLMLSGINIGHIQLPLGSDTKKRKEKCLCVYDLLIFLYLLIFFFVLKLSEPIKAVGGNGGRVTSLLPHITTHKRPTFHESIAAR